MRLGVNIDHVATLRQQRREDEPDLATAAEVCVRSGADGLTIHLREDRRHIIDADVPVVKSLTPHLNLEMALSPDIVELACKIKPQACCLVPEKREELTTEGGLNVVGSREALAPVIKRLQNEGITVSLFVDPEKAQLDAARDLGAETVEIHTGKYAQLTHDAQVAECRLIAEMAAYASSIGLVVHAGHGLKYYNVEPIARIPEIVELNIGHSIISRAIFVGLEQAVKEMKALLRS